jgi:Uma2 family endonuclease
MSPDDFLAWEIRQEDKHEFVRGRIVAMAGATRAHQTIARNALFALHTRLRGGPCSALHEHKILTPRGNWRYADVAVDCGAMRPNDLAAVEPKLVVEVDSPSTSFIEELERLEDYQSVSSVAHVLVLAQDRARARLYTRTESGWATSDFADLAEEIALSAFGFALPMAELYEDVGFE